MQASPRIQVTPVRALIDQTLAITVSGVPANCRVTVRASMPRGVQDHWESAATFLSDTSGQVDLATARPILGTYREPDPMGLFWSMSPTEGVPATPSNRERPGYQAPVNLTVEIDGTPLASCEFTQQLGRDDVRCEDVREGGLVATYFAPPEPGRVPGVIVVPGSQGGLPDAKAAFIASHGFATLSLAYFNAEHLPPDLAEVPLEYFQTAIRWMLEQPEVHRLAVTGASRGGELALLLGATYSEIKAVVAHAASGLVHHGRQDPGTGSDRSAWTLGGKPLPFRKFDVDLSDAVDSVAAIPVERIRGSVLMLSGREDPWRSANLVAVAEERLRRAAHPWYFERRIYEGAGHLVGAPPNFPSLILDPDTGHKLGGSPEGYARARTDGWARAFDLLEQLRGD